MKVALGFPQRDEQTGVYIKHGFREIGANVCVLHDPKIEPAETLLEQVRTTKPDLVFLSRTPGYNRIIEELSKSAVTATWNTDVRASVTQWSPIYPLIIHSHFYFTMSMGDIPDLLELNPNSYWLPEACAAIHQPDTTVTRKEYDLFWAGSINGQHEKYGKRVSLINRIRRVSESPLIYNGSNQSKKKIINEDHNRIVSSSKVCLGNACYPHIERAISARDYRIIGSGGFLLTSHVRGIEKIFNIGQECVTYTTIDDCIDKFRWYREHDEERERIANNGYVSAHERHRFYHRMLDVIRIVTDKG